MKACAALALLVLLAPAAALAAGGKPTTLPTPGSTPITPPAPTPAPAPTPSATGAAAAPQGAPAPQVPALDTSIAPTPVAGEAAPAPDPARWKGSVGAGLIVLTGNSDTTTFSGTGAVTRESPDWTLSAKAAGAYGHSRLADGGSPQTTVLNGAGQLRVDRKLGDGWSAFALGGLEADHVASVEYRTIAELGVGAQWLDVKRDGWQRLALRTDLGLRYGFEARYQYYGAPIGPLPGVEQLAPRFGVAFVLGFSKEVTFSEEAEAIPSLTTRGRVQAKAVSKLSSRLTQALTFGVAETVTVDSRPAAGKEPTDTALTALLEAAF